MKFHHLLEHVPDDAPTYNREDKRRIIDVLQSLRVAILQAMFIRAVSAPVCSRANGVSRNDVLEMVFTPRTHHALAQLRCAYPTHFPRIVLSDLTEPTDWPDGCDEGHEAIHCDYIDPIERAYGLSIRITTTHANVFGCMDNCFKLPGILSPRFRGNFGGIVALPM